MCVGIIVKGGGEDKSNVNKNKLKRIKRYSVSDRIFIPRVIHERRTLFR